MPADAYIFISKGTTYLTVYVCLPYLCQSCAEHVHECVYVCSWGGGGRHKQRRGKSLLAGDFLQSDAGQLPLVLQVDYLLDTLIEVVIATPYLRCAQQTLDVSLND